MNILHYSALAAMAIIMVSFGLLLWRLIKGPTLPDRVVALDTMASLCMGFIISYIVYSGQIMLFDMVLIIGLLSFLATVSYSIYLKKKISDE